MLVRRLKGGEEALYEDLDELSRATLERRNAYASTCRRAVGLVTRDDMSLQGCKQQLQGAMQEAAARLSRVRVKS
jgi:hypothetical protein